MTLKQGDETVNDKDDYVNSYQRWVDTVAHQGGKDMYPVDYPIVGLAAEVGEILEIKQKKERKGRVEYTKEEIAAIVDECGDALHYICRVLNDVNVPLSELMRMNIDKIERKRNKA